MSISFNPQGLLSGSGIDVSTVVSQLISQESAPEQIWQQQQSDLETQATALTSVNTDLNSLAAAVSSLSDPNGALAALAGTSSDPSLLTAAVQTSAVAGTHSIVINNLATTSSYYTNSILSNTTLSSGSFTLTVGTGSPTTFNISGNVTLQNLADSINTQNLGVTASVINDADGSRLSIISNSTGAAGDISITNDTSGLGFTKGGTGQNASLTVDGIPISSATNTVTGAIPGVTLSLLGSNPNETVQLTVGTDTNQATQAVNSFVAAYNQVIGDINQQFTVDPTTNSEGVLGSDSGLRSLQSSLLNDVTYSITGNDGLVNLASLGINMNDDGTLTVDNTQLNNVLASNPAQFQNFFQNASLTGFANNFNTDLTNLTDSTQGILNLELAQNTSQQQDLTNEIDDFQSQLAVQEQQLTDQYSSVNATLEEYPLLLEEVSMELGGASSNVSNSGNSGAAEPTGSTATSSSSSTSGL
jgi:flagellar hook-associated protein 2